MTVAACTCGHPSLRHYNGARVGRTGPCMDKACACRNYRSAPQEPSRQPILSMSPPSPTAPSRHSGPQAPLDGDAPVDEQARPQERPLRHPLLQAMDPFAHR